MKLDFSKVRVVGRDKDCTTLKHYAGHEIKIMHGKLSKENKEALEALHTKHLENKSKREEKARMKDGGEVFAMQAPAGEPPPKQRTEKEKRGEELGKGGKSGNTRTLEDVKKTLTNPQSWWAEGGQVGPQEQSQEDISAQLNNLQIPGMQPQYIGQPPPETQQPGIMQTLKQDLMSPAGNFMAPAPPVAQPQAPSPIPMGDVPQQAQAPEAMAQAPQAPSDPTGSAQYQKDMLGGIDLQKQALQEQFNAAQIQAKQTAAANLTYQAELHKSMNEFNDFNTKNAANIESTVNDIKNNTINPRAYQENMSASDKVSSAIGLMAGGFGQAFVGGDNPAMTWLNKQIDRDIAAQEKNQGNRVTLLNAYQQQYRDKASATNMARATLNQLYASQIAMAANSAATPQAKAQMLAGAGALQMKAAELVRSTTLTQYLGNLQNSNTSPEQQVAIMSQIDPKRADEMRHRMVPGVGFATLPEGAKTARETQVMTNSVKQDLGRLRQILQTPAKSLNLTLRAEADTLSKALVGALRVPITGPGAMSEGERALLLQLVPNPTSIFSIDSNTLTRLNTLESKMDRSYKNTLEANGMKLPQGYARNPNEGKVAVNAQGQRIIMKDGKWMPYGQ